MTMITVSTEFEKKKLKVINDSDHGCIKKDKTKLSSHRSAKASKHSDNKKKQNHRHPALAPIT